MPFNKLSEGEIRSIVEQSSRRYNQQITGIRAAATRPKLGGGSGSSGASALERAQAAATRTLTGQDVMDEMNAQGRQEREMNGFGWLDTMGDIGDSLTPVSAAIRDNMVAEILEPMPIDETPQNATQRILNFLGTGLYATARGVEGIGAAAAKVQQRIADPNEQASVPEIVAQGTGESLVNLVGGAARGIAEGFGARFDGERPRTQGQNLESIGVNDAIREGTAALGATEDGAHFFDNQNTYVGLAGLTADIAADPLSYVVGTGLTGAIRGGTRTAGQSARAAVAGEAGARNPFRIARDIARGAAAGRNEVLMELALARANRVSRAERRAGNVVSNDPLVTAEGNVFAGAAREATERQRTSEAAAIDDMVAEGGPVSVPRETQPAAAVDDAVPAAAPVEGGATPSVGPQMSALDEAVSGMRAEPTVKGDPQAVLTALRQGSDEVRFPPGTVDKLEAAMKMPAPKGGANKRAEAMSVAIAELKQIPGGQEFLSRPALLMNDGPAGGSPVSYESYLRGLAVNTALGEPAVAGGVSALRTSTLRAGSAGGVDAAALGEQLIASLGRRAAGKYDPKALADELNGLGEVEQLQVLTRILTKDGRLVKDFEDAMKLAMRDQISASNMRIMLNALGITTKAGTPKGIKAALQGRGVAKWDEIKASAPTEAEVMARNNISDDTVEAAGQVNTATLTDNATATARAESEESLGSPDAADQIEAMVGTDQMAPFIDDVHEQLVLDMQTGVRATDDVTQAARDMGIAARKGQRLAALAFAGAMKKIREVTPRVTSRTKETFDQEEWLAGWRGAVQAVRAAANRIKAGEGRGAAGLERGDMLFEPVMRAQRLATARALSEGRVPRLQHQFSRAEGKGTWIEDPVYLSVDQIIDMLPPAVAKRALFDLDYRLSKAGEGLSPAAREAQAQGISVFPTTLATMARAAMKGQDPLQGLKNGRRPSAYEKTPEGEAVIAEIAAELARPEIRRALRLLNDAQELAYVAFSIGKVNKVMGELGRRIISAVSRRGIGQAPYDRSLLAAEIQFSIETVERMAIEGGTSLAKELADERLTNGLLSLLGEPGTMVMRADARIAAADARPAAVKREEAVNAGKPAPKNPDGTVKQPSSSRSKESIEQQKEMQAQLNAARSQEAEEMEPLVIEATAQRQNLGEFEQTDLGTVEALHEVLADLGMFRIGAHVGRGVISDFGQGTLKPHQVIASSGLYMDTEMFVGALNRWANGGQGTTPLAARLAQDLGVEKVGVEEVNQFVGSWWTALARHEQNWAELTEGGQLSPEGLRSALIEGQSRAAIGEDGPLDAVAPLSERQADMAMELREFIRDAYSALERSGADSDVLAYYMQKFGFRDSGDFGGVKRIDPNLPLATQATIWRSYEIADGSVQHPLDMLANVHKAARAAMVRPSIAQTTTALHGRKPDANWDVARLRAAGYKQPAATTEMSVARYLDGDYWYPQEIFEQIAYVDYFLKKTDRPGGGIISDQIAEVVLRPYDIATGILKSSQTVWNPAHHVANVLGEHFALLLAGRNPMKSPRSWPVLKSLGQMMDADGSAIDAYRAMTATVKDGTLTPAGPGGKWDGARVSIGGKFVDLTPEQIGQMALQDGVAVTARQSKDLVFGLNDDVGGNGSKLWKTITNSRVNPIAWTDKKLGEFSAVRDNWTRIAHYIDALESQKWPNLEAARVGAANEVHKFHPTIQTLSAGELKIGRRLIMYYTWVKQMAWRVVNVALEKPALVTIPSKIQYNMAEANGLEPESIGKPFNDDPRIAPYYKKGVLGPSWLGGFAPFQSADDIPIDPETGEPMAPEQMWGMSLSTPQMDALYTLFGGLNAGESPQEAAWHYAQLGNVFLKMPAELMTDSRIGGIGAPPSNDIPGYLASQTGMPYRLAGALGMRPKAAFTEEENAGEQARLGLNWLTGFKLTNYTNATSAAVARSERSKADREYLRNLGYNEEQVDAIVKVWRLARDAE